MCSIEMKGDLTMSNVFAFMLVQLIIGVVLLNVVFFFRQIFDEYFTFEEIVTDCVRYVKLIETIEDVMWALGMIMMLIILSPSILLSMTIGRPIVIVCKKMKNVATKILKIKIRDVRVS